MGARRFARSFEDGQTPGVALWLPAPGAEPTPELLERSGMAGLPDLLGPEAWGRFEASVGAIEASQERAVPPPHWNLWALGVDPAWQRRGLGSILLRRFRARAETDGVPARFWTVEAATVPFYRRHGFETVAEDMEAGSGLRYWIFRNAGPGPGR